MQLEKLDIELTYENYATYETYETMQFYATYAMRL
jgi:hypothetical protein